jgi:hypothetical protein
MARLIDADSLCAEDFENCTPYQAQSIIDDAPTVDAAPVVHGKWHKRGNEKTCSVCEFIYYSNNDEWNYCPNCGAKMDGKRKASE